MKLYSGRCPVKPDAIFIFMFQGKKSLSQAGREVNRLTEGALGKILNSGFQGKRKEAELLIIARGRWRFAVILGLGEREKVDGECFREAIGAGLKRISRYKVNRVELELIDVGVYLSLEEQARAIGEGFWFSSYRYKEFRSFEDKAPKEAWFLGAESKIRPELTKAEIIGEEHGYVRDLINRPGSELGPLEFCGEARKSGKKFGFTVKVYDEKHLARMKYNGIIQVGQGSKSPPRLIELIYSGGGKNKPLIALCGKGVTFDSGGISIKGSEGMEKMKYDMAGAGSVLGVMRSVARLKMKVSLLGVLPLVENMPSGDAQRPGDIIRMADGTTVEVISTDAEGRLILADALYHCQRFKPKEIIDIATLTGAVRIALGRFAIGLMGNDEGLISRITQAGAKAGERCWVLPLWDEYKELIKSEVADIKNGSWAREAGTIIGGIFLKQFVKGVPWTHLDIASTAWSDEPHPYLGKGPTGKGMRLLVRYLEEFA